MWYGNHERRATRAKFKPSSETATLVQPGIAFVPDSFGGYGAPSVTGDRHDQVSNKAPAWLGDLVAAIAHRFDGMSDWDRASRSGLWLKKEGSAGKYRFWGLPFAGASEADVVLKGISEARQARKAKWEKTLEQEAAMVAAFTQACEMAGVEALSGDGKERNFTFRTTIAGTQITGRVENIDSLVIGGGITSPKVFTEDELRGVVFRVEGVSSCECSLSDARNLIEGRKKAFEMVCDHFTAIPVEEPDHRQPLGDVPVLIDKDGDTVEATISFGGWLFDPMVTRHPTLRKLLEHCELR